MRSTNLLTYLVNFVDSFIMLPVL